MEDKIIKCETNNDLIDDLIEEIKGLLCEGVFQSRWLLLETYHKIGGLLIDAEKTTPDTVSRLTQEIPKQKRTLYRCVQFVKQFPDINALPEGKNISWSKIVNKYLPEHKEKKDPPTLDEKIKQFLADMFPAETNLRKELITQAIKDWEAYG